jgi:RNA polymerase sigma-70 factor (ECF subfamily)
MATDPLKQQVIKLKKGQMDVFDEIYHQTKSSVYYTILGILKDPSLSEDIMQETYLKALEKIDQYKPTYLFVTWLTTIAKNLAINEYNKRKREISVDIEEQDYMIPSSGDTSYNEAMIRELMVHLSEDERMIILYHIVENYKFKDIARMLDKPLGTVTWSYQNALQKLRKIAKEGEIDEEQTIRTRNQNDSY